jgi:hypothetical protein
LEDPSTVDKKLRANLIFHGAIVILLGMLAGFPFALVAMGSMEGEVRAWRMAHLEGVLNGLLCIAAGAVGRNLALGAGAQRLMTWSFVVMAYGNVLASIFGAWTGQRGLEFAMPVSNMIVFATFMVAVVAVFVGLILLAYGARPGAAAIGGDVTVEVKRATTATPRAPSSSISRGVDVEVSVSRPGGAQTSAAAEDDDPGDDDTPVNRAQRRRAKKSR